MVSKQMSVHYCQESGTDLTKKKKFLVFRIHSFTALETLQLCLGHRDASQVYT